MPFQKTLSSGGEGINTRSPADYNCTPNNDQSFLIQPCERLEKNLDKIMIINYKLRDDRMELKIIPFQDIEKIDNERFN